MANTTTETTELTQGRGQGQRRRGIDRRTAVIAIACAALIVVTGVVVGTVWFRSQESFCDRAANLPDLTSTIDTDTTPAAALRSYADQLNAIAAVAPDASTRDAARTLASSQRAIGDALASDPTNGATLDAITKADTPAVAAARTRLQITIDDRCR